MTAQRMQMLHEPQTKSVASNHVLMLVLYFLSLWNENTIDKITRSPISISRSSDPRPGENKEILLSLFHKEPTYNFLADYTPPAHAEVDVTTDDIALT
jgi:hypothetical protein